MTGTVGQRGRVTVLTANPAIDITYRCDRPRWGEVNRVQEVTRRAGGKGLNVANVLTQLGVPVRVTGFLGGRGGEELQQLLAASPLQQDWAPIDGETRATTAIHHDPDTTMFNEAGPSVQAGDWHRLTTATVAGLRADDVLVVSGSCPPGTSAEDLLNLLGAARQAGARTFLDTSGSLLVAAASQCDLVKPNQEELQQATGLDDPADGARALLERGAGAVVVSAGSSGMDLYQPSGSQLRVWHADPPAVVAGNPTGAGDAAAAALALGLLGLDHDPDSLVRSLGSAVCLAAAAVLAPVAGVYDAAAYRDFQNLVTIKDHTHVTR